MPQEFTLQPSPVRTNNLLHSTVPGYAEGTWTPVLNFGGSTVGITYANQVANFIKIGRLVTYTIFIRLTAVGAAFGSAFITGQPYALPEFYAGGLNSPGRVLWHQMTSSLVHFSAVIFANEQQIRLRGIAAAATSSETDLVVGNFANNTELTIQISHAVE